MLLDPFIKLVFIAGLFHWFAFRLQAPSLHINAVSLTHRQLVSSCCLSWSVYVQIQTVLWKLWWGVLHWHGLRNIHNYFWILDTPERERVEEEVRLIQRDITLHIFCHVLCPFVTQGSLSLTWGAVVCHLAPPPRALHLEGLRGGGAPQGDGQRGFPNIASPTSLCLSLSHILLWFGHLSERPQGCCCLLEMLHNSLVVSEDWFEKLAPTRTWLLRDERWMQVCWLCLSPYVKYLLWRESLSFIIKRMCIYFIRFCNLVLSY